MTSTKTLKRKIILSGNPVSTNLIYRKHGHIIYMSKEGKELKESYQWEAKKYWKEPPIEGDVEIEIELFF